MKNVEELRKEYPKDLPLVLDSMDDKQAPPEGTKGKVVWVDDLGDILVDWENGSSLSLVPGVDKFHVEDLGLPADVLRGILFIRQTGKTNMFDIPKVYSLAWEENLIDLALWLEDHRKEYAKLIMTGRAK